MQFSIIIPVYNSHTTIERCLLGVQNLKHPSFEVFLVDSSPDDRSSEIIKRFPQYRLMKSKRRLLMHAARNLAIQHASGSTIVCLDPDCVPEEDWLTRLEDSLGKGFSVVGGGIAFSPSSSMNLAAHIVKFSLWFPGDETRLVADLPTANLAIRRKALDAVGGFSEDYIAGDTELCHRLRRHGYENFFDGRAVVHHIHEVTFRSLGRERFKRGIDFGVMRAATQEWNTMLSLLTIVGMPLLALRQFYWKFKASASHGYLTGFLRMAPVILCCDFAWMTGVAIGKARSLVRPRSPA
ncbi:MAG: glycosyltransferase family 2 protein [Bacteroidota bacterium]